MDSRRLVHRALGVPDAVVGKDCAAGWLMMVAAKQTKREDSNRLAEIMCTTAASAVIDQVVDWLDGGLLDSEIVGSPTRFHTFDEIVGDLAHRTQHATADESILGRAKVLDLDIWLVMCRWTLRAVIDYAKQNPVLPTW